MLQFISFYIVFKGKKYLQTKRKQDYFFLNYNLTPLNMYNGLPQAYCIKLEGRIHLNNLGDMIKWEPARYGPPCEKTCLRGLRTTEEQTSLCSLFTAFLFTYWKESYLKLLHFLARLFRLAVESVDGNHCDADGFFWIWTPISLLSLYKVIVYRTA